MSNCSLKVERIGTNRGSQYNNCTMQGASEVMRRLNLNLKAKNQAYTGIFTDNQANKYTWSQSKKEFEPL